MRIKIIFEGWFFCLFLARTGRFGGQPDTDVRWRLQELARGKLGPLHIFIRKQQPRWRRFKFFGRAKPFSHERILKGRCLSRSWLFTQVQLSKLSHHIPNENNLMHSPALHHMAFQKRGYCENFQKIESFVPVQVYIIAKLWCAQKFWQRSRSRSARKFTLALKTFWAPLNFALILRFWKAFNFSLEGKICQQHSRTRILTGFEKPALFSLLCSTARRKGREF